MKLHSIRYRITAITVGVILATVLSIIAVCYTTVRNESIRRSVEVMRLVSKDTQNTLDEYFQDIESSVIMAADDAAGSLDSVILVECAAAGTHADERARTDEQTARLNAYLEAHCAEIQKTFENLAGRTHGVIAYYYCISPAVSRDVHGFCYSRVGKAGFDKQQALDPKTLDPKDTEHNAWYFTALERGRPSWIGPYRAYPPDEMWICSYVEPIYCAGTLVGLLGMDIPLETLTEQVRPIRIYETGFASLSDADGNIFFHPAFPQGSRPELGNLSASRDLLHNEDSGDTLVRYTMNGEKRQMAFRTLRNGMKLIVTAPVREINSTWTRLIRVVLIVTAAAIVLYAAVLLFAMGLLTQPLQKLTAASRRLAAADYDVELDYRRPDEVGELTEAFRQMRDKQKGYIDALNHRLYTDDLTGLPNMRHFFELAQTAKDSLLSENKEPVMLYFNLIGTKHFNRQFGFEEGNKLLCAIADILERHFGRDCLCRVGLDQFAAVADAASAEEELRQIFAEAQNANGGQTLPLRVGIYRYSLEVVNVGIACDRAKYASDLRRGTYQSGFSYFKKGMQKAIRQARYVANHLDQAMEERWIQVYFQPLIRAVNGKVCDEEALSRWIDPEQGFLSPAEYVPALEGAGLIYKLDLYVLDRVLEKMQTEAAAGHPVIPCSINLSRSDFDACDVVEEFRSRVDAAGIPRDRITVEITESIIGSSFEFMKAQVARFRSLGFPVWMDDFGSGYSSLDVLQSIRFDLIKFDMAFMRRLDESESGRVILTKLMEMATAIGVDTACEGVETEAQVQFLREVGCTKLQGYYFSKAISHAELSTRFETGLKIGFENPEEAFYYEAVGRINLYDLGVLAANETSAFRSSFNTLPMCIVEIRGDEIRFMRSNQSYRDFVRRFFGVDLSPLGAQFQKKAPVFMENVAKACVGQNLRTFFDKKMADGSTVHAFACRIGTNPVSGNVAVAVAVLSISAPNDSETYADIARALAADYYNIYVVDLNTDRFIEYRSRIGGDELAVERRGERFFDAVRQDAAKRIYPEDLDGFLAAFSREGILKELEAQAAFTTIYRLIDTGVPIYANMKITRMPGGNRIIIGISIIDAQMKQQEAAERERQERTAFERIAALSGNYIAIYAVDPVTGHYVEYSGSIEYESYGLPKEGADFFAAVRENSPKYVNPDDLPTYLCRTTRENILREIHLNGLFYHNYHLVIGGEARPVSLRAALVRESGGDKLIVGINWIDDRTDVANGKL